MRRTRRWRRRGGAGRAALLLLLILLPALFLAERRISAVKTEIQQAALQSFGLERISETVQGKLKPLSAGENGNVILDTYALAEMKTELTEALRRSLTDTAAAWVPIGNLTGVSVLNGLGFSVPVFFRVEGVATVEFSSVLESAGINRTRYGVTMTVTARLYNSSVSFPDAVTVTTQYPVFESVTSGEVPGVYAGTG